MKVKNSIILSEFILILETNFPQKKTKEKVKKKIIRKIKMMKNI